MFNTKPASVLEGGQPDSLVKREDTRMSDWRFHKCFKKHCASGDLCQVQKKGAFAPL